MLPGTRSVRERRIVRRCMCLTREHVLLSPRDVVVVRSRVRAAPDVHLKRFGHRATFVALISVQPAGAG